MIGNKYTVLSLGWGVQSFTLAAMAALGEFDLPDIVIHADTKNEKQATYDFIKKYSYWLHCFHVSHNKVSENDVVINEVHNGKFIPAFTYNKDGSKGQALRTCTGRWKIAPIRRLIRETTDEPVELWIGISTDEATRMRSSDVGYITNRYPLIEMRMSRNDCIDWLTKNGFDIPPKSACWFCPYQDFDSWRYLQTQPDDFKKAIALDWEIRNKREPVELYLHPSRKPLEEVDFRTMEEKGQMRLWDEECSGICGV